MTTATAVPLSANDRLKKGFDTRLGVSLLVAVGVHLVAFVYAPEMRAPDWGAASPDEITTISMPEVDIPPPPTDVPRPSAPMISVDAPADATIPDIGFREYVENPPPPPAADANEASDQGIAFVPYTVAPRLLNGREVQQALERAYPAALRDAGLGGTVSLLVHVDAEGRVMEARVGASSGFGPIDQAAIGLADVMRFSPAMNRDTRVAVWIQLPLTFQVR